MLGGLKKAVESHGEGSLLAVLSPMLATEEAYLLGQYVRSLDPQATLLLGPVPTADADETFKHYLTGEETFRIQAEKVPNRRGVERVLKILGGRTGAWDDLGDVTRRDEFRAGWITGGYLDRWVGTDAMPANLKNAFLVASDILPNAATEAADVVLPAASWAEKAGCWENYQERIQPFEAGIDLLPGVLVEGEAFAELLGRDGGYDVAAIRQELAEKDAAFADVGFAEADEAGSTTFEFAELSSRAGSASLRAPFPLQLRLHHPLKRSSCRPVRTC